MTQSETPEADALPWPPKRLSTDPKAPQKVWIILQGDRGSQDQHIVDVVDSEQKAKDYPEHPEDAEYYPRWAEEWEVK